MNSPATGRRVNGEEESYLCLDGSMAVVQPLLREARVLLRPSDPHELSDATGGAVGLAELNAGLPGRISKGFEKI